MAIKILSTGFYVPEKVITNDDLSKMVETSDEWIVQRVGIRERHVSVNETAADFAIKAAESALKKADVRPDEIDLIVAATISSDTVCPTVAGIVEQAIGASCPCFDINSACSGFIFALDTAAAFLQRGGIRHALVIGAERLSKLMDWNDRSTCVIFGDGAGAALIAPGENYLSSHLSTQGGSDVIKIPSYVGVSPFYEGVAEAPTIFMDGQETFKFAVNKIVNDIKYVVEQAGLTLDQIDHVVTHQANIRIIEFASKRLKIDIDKFFINIDKYGNTSAASVPIALSELEDSGKLKRGDTIVLSAFGGGLSSAACVVRY